MFRILSATLLSSVFLMAFGPMPPLPVQDGGEEWKVPTRAAKKKNPLALDDATLARGKAAYVKECLSCHGEKGKGDGPGAKDLEKPVGDLSNPKVWSQTDGALYFKITEGRKPMPAFDKMFTDEQRWQLVTYIRTLAPKPNGEGK